METQNRKEMPMSKIVSLVWMIGGGLVLLTFFMDQYAILSQGIRGTQLFEMLDKDLSKLAEFLGEFTTFMLFFSVVVGMLTALGLLILGISTFVSGRIKGWIVPGVLAGAAFVIYLLTYFLLDSEPNGSNVWMNISFGKFMPKPDIGFYLSMLLHLGMGLFTVIQGFRGKLEVTANTDGLDQDASGGDAELPASDN